MYTTTRPRAPVAATLAVVASALLGGCSIGEGTETTVARRPSSTTTAVEHPYERRLEQAACADPALPTDRISCSTLTLPEDRSVADGPTVQLPVIRTAASGTGAATNTERAPIVVVHGGPGAGVVSTWAMWTTAFDDLGAELVLYDQRGGGQAEPRLDCPEHTRALLDALGDGSTDPADRAAEQARVTEAVRACHERHVERGVDLDQYDTPTSTRDLEDLRRALGAERITLLASSYGTRLALDYLRTHPERVHSLVLDAVDPPDRVGAVDGAGRAPEAIERFADACDADASCARRYGDLPDALARIVERYDATPAEVVVPDPDTGADRTLELTGDDLQAGLFAALYDTEVIPILPSLIRAIDRDGAAVFPTIASRVMPSLTTTAMGAFLSVDCADAAGRSPEPTSSERTSTLGLSGSFTFCDDWQVEPVEETFGDLVSPADPPPTLVIAGELDPITPVEDSRRAAELLDGRYLEVPRGGHAPMLVDTCARTTVRAFLSDPDGAAPSCASQLVALPFG